MQKSQHNFSPIVLMNDGYYLLQLKYKVTNPKRLPILTLKAS